MDSEELTTEQARQMNESLFRVANYLHRSSSGWKNGDFPRTIDSIGMRSAPMTPSAALEWNSTTSRARAGSARPEKRNDAATCSAFGGRTASSNCEDAVNEARAGRGMTDLPAALGLVVGQYLDRIGIRDRKC